MLVFVSSYQVLHKYVINSITQIKKFVISVTTDRFLTETSFFNSLYSSIQCTSTLDKSQ
jgi:hypothetical protein